MSALKILRLTYLLLPFFAAQSSAYNVQLFRPDNLQGLAAELLREELKLPKEAMIVEDFEKEQLTGALKTNVKGGGVNSRGYGTVSQNPSAWDGKMASTEHNAASFEILVPGIRMFGVGLGDNDGGSETISINGEPPISLSNLPNHTSNSGGRAYYLLIRAGSNEADIQKVVFDGGFTIAFDHLILATSRTGRAGVSRNSPSPPSRLQDLDAMAQRIRQEETTLEKSEPQGPQSGSQIMRPTRILTPPVGPQNEMAAKMQSLRQAVLNVHGSRENALKLVEILRDAKEPLAIRRTALNCLGHIHLKDPDIWNAVDAILTGSDRDIFGVAGDHRIQNGGFDQPIAPNGNSESGAFGETMLSPGSVTLANWSVYDGIVGFRDDCPSPAGGKVLELGPRATPGGIAQTIRTRPGQKYRLNFFTCSGRGAFHFNSQLRVQAADINKVVDCPTGSKHKRVEIPFEALAPLTTISIFGMGSEGFGPVVDDVQVELNNTP